MRLKYLRLNWGVPQNPRKRAGWSAGQAGLVFKLAEQMIRLSPELSKIVRIVPSQKTLIGWICNVEYKAISAESGSAHGLSPRLAILGERGEVRGARERSEDYFVSLYRAERLRNSG